MLSTRSQQWNIKCCNLPCKATAKIYPTRKFFNFPKKGSNKYENWLQACFSSITEIQAKKKPYICSDHFQEKYIVRKFLRKGAIPSPNLENSADVRNIRSPSPHMDRSKVFNTYTRITEENDFTFEELNETSKYVLLNSDERLSSVSCTNCPKHFKVIKNLRKKVEKLNAEVKALKNLNSTFRRTHKIFKDKIVRNRTTIKKLKKNFIHSVDSINNASENAKIFAKMILLQPRTYSESEKKISQCIYFRSSAGYTFLRNVLQFHMPHPTSLQKWTKIKNLSPGMNNNILREVKNQVDYLEDKDKEVILMFDEMAIQENLVYNKTLDRVDGYEVYGNGESKQNFAKNVLVFMIRSICGNFKHVLHYIACSPAITSDVLKNELYLCLQICTKIGVQVKGITCDQGPINRKLFRTLEISPDKTFFEFENKEIFGIFDVPHLFKTFRNRLLKSDIETPDGIVSWDIVAHIYNSEKNNKTKICPKLTYSHIYPTDFQKMSVKLAVQVVSHSVSAGIKSFLDLKKFNAELENKAEATQKCFEKMNKLFDILNGNPPLMRSSVNFEYLVEMKKYIINIKSVESKAPSFCFKGFLLSIESIIKICAQIFEKNTRIYYIYAAKFNQDTLENLFAHIRARNGNKTNPSLFEFNRILAKIVTMKLLFTSSFSNCETDNDEYISLDWDAIFENSAVATITIELDNPNSNTSFDEEDEDMEILSITEEHQMQPHLGTTEVALKYFAGYCFTKIMTRLEIPCEKCTDLLTDHSRSDPDISNILIKSKKYKNCRDGLVTPSFKFFEICMYHNNIFKQIFDKYPHQKNIKEIIVNKCIEATQANYPEWFQTEEDCNNHRIKILDFMILVLIRKNCMWFTDVYRSKKKEKCKRNKFKSILNQ